uniref:Uncharacterized protein n=1 Tax=Arundo donax TaxID=35708 RepID=A0A0A9G840_ARUDO
MTLCYCQMSVSKSKLWGTLCFSFFKIILCVLEDLAPVAASHDYQLNE